MIWADLLGFCTKFGISGSFVQDVLMISPSPSQLIHIWDEGQSDIDYIPLLSKTILFVIYSSKNWKRKHLFTQSVQNLRQRRKEHTFLNSSVDRWAPEDFRIPGRGWAGREHGWEFFWLLSLCLGYFFLYLKILTGHKWRFCYLARFFPGRKNFFDKAASYAGIWDICTACVKNSSAHSQLDWHIWEMSDLQNKRSVHHGCLGLTEHKEKM